MNVFIFKVEWRFGLRKVQEKQWELARPENQVKTQWNAERVWIIAEDQQVKVACCTLYLRVESPKTSQFYKDNQELLSQIEAEKIELENSGYNITIMGDFNACIKPGSRFDFKNYPHETNNTGQLLIDFTERTNMYCMNPLPWNGAWREDFTYQRDVGIRLNRSIIDYGLATTHSINQTKSFKVTDDAGLSIESDHSSLYWQY